MKSKMKNKLAFLKENDKLFVNNVIDDKFIIINKLFLKKL